MIGIQKGGSWCCFQGGFGGAYVNTQSYTHIYRWMSVHAGITTTSVCGIWKRVFQKKRKESTAHKKLLGAPGIAKRSKDATRSILGTVVCQSVEVRQQ